LKNVASTEKQNPTKEHTALCNTIPPGKWHLIDNQPLLREIFKTSILWLSFTSSFLNIMLLSILKKEVLKQHILPPDALICYYPVKKKIATRTIAVPIKNFKP